MDTPHVLPLESGVVRAPQIAWAERTPAGWGMLMGLMFVTTGLYQRGEAFYGLILCGLWHGFWVLAGQRDPQWGAVMWRQWVTRPYPDLVQAWPDVGAEEVPLEPSVPVR